MQKIVLFIEPNIDACLTSDKIGNLFMNRFAVDEEASTEIIQILEFKNVEIQKEYLNREEKQLKEMNDHDIIDAGIKSINNLGKDNSMLHMIYCGEYYFDSELLLEKMIVIKMRKYGIQSSILSYLSTHRENLITREKCKLAYQGKLKNVQGWKDYEGSINDDLETFFANHKISNGIKQEIVRSFFTPKLTPDELKLVEEKNKQYMYTFIYGFDADIDSEEMKKTQSKNKFVHAKCTRRTICLNT